MPFLSEFKTLAGNIGGAIWPSPSRSKVFLESLGRGVSWALVLWLTLAIPLMGLTLNAKDLGLSLSSDDLTRSIVFLSIAASGSFIQLVVDGAAFQQGTYYLDLGIAPSLITLLIGFVAYRSGTRIKEFRNTTDSLKELSGFSSLGLGVGFAGAFYLASLVASGSILNLSVVQFAPMSPVSIIWVFSVVAIPAWLGSLRTGNRKSSSAWRWAYSAIRTFGIFYVVLMGITALVYLSYSWIAPVFADSSPLPVEASSQGQGPNGWLVLGVILAVLLFLPTITFNLFAVALGAEYSYQIDYLGLDVLAATDNLPLMDGISFVSSLGAFSILSTLGAGAFIAVLFAVIVASLISGVAATGKASFDAVFRRDLVAGLAAVFFVGFVLRSVAQFGAFWTNRGVPAQEATEGSLPLEEGSLTIGITSASLALALAIIASFIVLGGSKSSAFVHESFPRLVSSLSGKQLESNIDRGLLPLIFGRAVAIVAALAVVLPLGTATIERTWAAIDTPTNKFREVAELVETGELEKLKEFITKDRQDEANWLPDDVLQTARPAAATRRTIEVTNGWDDAWKIGQLDAYGKVSWNADSGPVVLNLGTRAKISDHFRFVQHANYTATAQPLNLTISYGGFLTAAGRSEISINGVSVPVGTYSAIPGMYTVKSPGFKLVAPSETVFVTNGSDMSFKAKEQALLPANAVSVLDKEIKRKADECGKFSTLNTSLCFTLEDIYANRTPVGSAPAENYFAIKTGEFKVEKSSCSGVAVDELLAAESVKRTTTCAIEMTFEVTYFESKIEVSDVFTTQTFNACPGLSVPCTRTRPVKVGTRETEVIGERIGQGTMASSVPFSVVVRGTLKDDGSFVIIDRFVPPVYEIVKPAPEKPAEEPVKLLGYYKDLEALLSAHPIGQLGDGYVVSPALNLYVWDGRRWTLVGRR